MHKEEHQLLSSHLGRGRRCYRVFGKCVILTEMFSRVRNILEFECNPWKMIDFQHNLVSSSITHVHRICLLSPGMFTRHSYKVPTGPWNHWKCLNLYIEIEILSIFFELDVSKQATSRCLHACLPQLHHCFTYHLPQESAAVTCTDDLLTSNDAGYSKRARRLTLSEPSALPRKWKFQDSLLTREMYKDWLVCNTVQLRRVHTFKPLSLSF